MLCFQFSFAFFSRAIFLLPYIQSWRGSTASHATTRTASPALAAEAMSASSASTSAPHANTDAAPCATEAVKDVAWKSFVVTAATRAKRVTSPNCARTASTSTEDGKTQCIECAPPESDLSDDTCPTQTGPYKRQKTHYKPLTKEPCSDDDFECSVLKSAYLPCHVVMLSAM